MICEFFFLLSGSRVAFPDIWTQIPRASIKVSIHFRRFWGFQRGVTTSIMRWRSQLETLTRERNERSRKSRVFVTGGRIDRITRLSPLPPSSFRPPSSSPKNSPSHHPQKQFVHEKRDSDSRESRKKQRPDDQLATKDTPSHANRKKVTRKTRTRESHSRRSRSDACEENPPTHRS